MWSVIDKEFRALYESGSLDIVFPDGRRSRYGDGSGKQVVLRFHDRWFSWKFLRSPALAVGEAFMDGGLTFDTGTIRDYLELTLRNLGPRAVVGLVPSLLHRLRLVGRRLVRANSVDRSRRNVAHHYDLSNRLYELFLDSDRQYSCAYFRRPEEDIQTAQERKKRRLAAKLCLEPGHRVLDIGSGWGGLGLHIARAENVQVTGVTLSREQHQVAQARAAALGLQDRVRFRLADYRDVADRFDRIVSVGMFEHVGLTRYRTFFERLRDLLTDDGIALLHTIGRADGPSTTNPWIQKYIFPGGYSPALSEVLPHIERVGLFVTDIEVLRLHYAYTLQRWQEAFARNRDHVRDLYDERFCRMWEFYLCASEMAFRHGGHVVFQIQLAKRQDAAPITRAYLDDGLLDATDSANRRVAAARPSAWNRPAAATKTSASRPSPGG